MAAVVSNGCGPFYVVALSQIEGLDGFPFHAATPSVYQARSRRICLPLDWPVLSYFKSEPVSLTQFICCNCHDTDPASIATTFFSTRWAVELHISRSKVCKAAGKGVRSVPVVYRESRRAEDHEAGLIGAPGPWPVRRALF